MNSTRQFGYDVIRAVACFFVVVVHTTMLIDVSNLYCDILKSAIMLVAITANAMFFMMSGKFNLTKKNQGNWGSFYIKRFASLIVPVAIYFFVRTLYNELPEWPGFIEFGKQFLKDIFFNYASTEYWFIYPLVGFLLAAPFLSVAFCDMTKHQAYIFVGVGVVFNGLTFLMSNIGIDLSWNYLFSGFGFVFFSGPLIETLVDSKKNLRVSQGIAFFSFVLTLILQYGLGFESGIYDISPLYFLLAVGIYVTLLDFGNKIKGSRMVSFVAKHSLGVYLTHMMVLYPLNMLLGGAEGPVSLSVFGMGVIFVFIFSLMLGVVIDEMLVKPMQKATRAFFASVFSKNETSRV